MALSNTLGYTWHSVHLALGNTWHLVTWHSVAWHPAPGVNWPKQAAFLAVYIKKVHLGPLGCYFYQNEESFFTLLDSLWMIKPFSVLYWWLFTVYRRKTNL